MASKRKSTVPCMIPTKRVHLREELEQEPPVLVRQAWGSAGGRHSPLDHGGEGGKQEVGEGAGTYTCRPCNFETHDLNLFLDHVYSGHPDFRADPSFLCVDCGASAPKFEGLALHNARVHPSTMNTTLQLRRRERRVVVEQNLVVEPDAARDSEISITKTPIMRRLKGRSEAKRIVVSHAGSDDSSSSDTVTVSSSRLVERKDTPTVTVTHVPTIVHNGVTKVSLPSAIQIVNGSGSLPMLKTAITQVVSVVQNRTFHQSSPITVSSGSSNSSSASSKNLPKVMIPLSSIPTYSASMDSSPYLKTSFSKFSYPTKAELCYLTVVTKFPEEQIKIWFTAQRLKQGISWSPEEIEDARRKMFNTIIQTAPSGSNHQRQTSNQHTITVLPATGIPHILQGSLVSQGGVIVTQPVMANGFQVSGPPISLAVTPKPQATARPMMQARPAAALVADKGISMVVGTVGSSSNGSNVIINSSRSLVGGATSIISSFSGSNGIRSSTAASGQASVINLSLGNSNHGNTNGKINIVNGKVSRAAVDAINGKSNGAVDSAKSSSNSGGGDIKKVQVIQASAVKSAAANRPSTDVKNPTDSKGADGGNSGANKCIASAIVAPTSVSMQAVSTATGSPSALKAEAASSSPASKSASPSPAFHPSGAPGSRTPNALLDASCSKAKKSQEQLNALKDSFVVNQFPDNDEVDRLISLTGLTVREVRKWFSDRRYHFRNLKGSRTSAGAGGGGDGGGKKGGTPGAGGAAGGGGGGGGGDLDVPDGNAGARTPQQASAPLSPSPSQTPTSPTTPSRRTPRPPSPDFTAIRYKEREPHQLKALEASFAQEAEPSGEEVDRLRAETKMTRREIHGWFAEKRKKVAAERKREEAERAARGAADDTEPKEGADGMTAANGVRREEAEDKQKEDGLGEPKVNPIKINLKMLKVTEANGKPESEGSEAAGVPPLPAGASPSPSPALPSSATTKQPQSQSPRPLASAGTTTTTTAAGAIMPKPSPLRGKKTAEQLHLLKQVYARTQWPSAPQYDELIKGTALLRPEVVRWFGDCRYVQKNGQLKWLEAYQSMVLEEDLQKDSAQTLQTHLDAHGGLEDPQVKELSQASGLTEDLVRYWFSTKTTPLPPPPQAQAEAAAPDRTGHVSPGTAAATETHEKPERTGASESPPLKAPGESEEPKADGGTKEVEEEEEEEKEKEEESSEPTPSKGTD
ncbi:zinc fingers and homeoboxes protein 3 [Gadus morhua]|uniref:Zinc fingers and homeoboxes 3b n=1 Tax=Gadus morhua TaxID=8049 RepID=A0A8C4Z0D9_GADMO|nr:zinc fingers and homeoboxes protein 3 [Gadus morhua]XP_030215018.1 zinc fingers and homeoboxes protein 3 [Gadus morhua]